MLGQLLAFGTLASWAASDLVAKHAVGKQSTLHLIFWGQLLGGVGILLLGLLFGQVNSLPLASMVWVGLLALLNVGGMALFYGAIRHKGVALSLPIIYSWSVPTIVLGFVFLHELPSLLQAAGVAAVIIGLFLVSIEPGNKRWVDSGTIAAFFSMMTWGVFYFLITTPSELYGEWWTSGAIKVLSGLLVLPLLLREKSHSPSKSSKDFWTVGLIGLCDALGLVMVSNALQIASSAVVTGIISTTPAVVATLGILFYKEKVTHQQLTGIIVTVLGLILLVL